LCLISGKTSRKRLILGMKFAVTICEWNVIYNRTMWNETVHILRIWRMKICAYRSKQNFPTFCTFAIHFSGCVEWNCLCTDMWSESFLIWRIHVVAHMLKKYVECTKIQKSWRIWIQNLKYFRQFNRGSDEFSWLNHLKTKNLKQVITPPPPSKKSAQSQGNPQNVLFFGGTFHGQKLISFCFGYLPKIELAFLKRIIKSFSK
jgi:hypothetical protein